MVITSLTRATGREGFMLLVSLVVLMFLATMGLSMTKIVLDIAINSQLEIDRQKALYLSEAGIARAIHEMRTDDDADRNGLGNVRETLFGDGTYAAVHDSETATIIGIGEVNDIKRRIQIKYSSL